MLPVNPMDKKSALLIVKGRRIAIIAIIAVVVIVGVLIAVFSC
ncbi:MAG: hypothetical protein AB1Z19_06805 [Eubacteriales bacterium]